jgi:two-component system NtrC family sensor kinase
MRAFWSNIHIFYSEKTGRIFNWVPDCFKEDFLSLKLAKQITLGYALMFFLMVLISGFSIYSIYRLDKDASNIKGRYSTLSSLISDQKSKPQVYFSDDMLTEAIRIADEQVKYAYITIFTVVGIVLVFGGALTFIVPRVITRPILRLADATQKVASGNLSHRVESLDGSSEISMLTQAFNNMLESIEYHEKELEKKNAENLKLLDKMKRFNEVLELRIEEATREIREKQEELIRAEKLAIIGEMASGIAHEIRNPLSGIAIALELMKNESSNPEHRQTISEILKELNRLERIIKELFQLGHPKSLNVIECDPNEIVETALNLVSLKAKEKGITIEKRLECREKFQVDPEQIEQVVINLLINGIDAINGSFGKLTVETGSSNGNVRIIVSDTGCGLSPEIKEKIFQPFYSTKKSGTGLGLSISRRIVETHKGSILIASEEGRGSTFTVEIPKNLSTEQGD